MTSTPAYPDRLPLASESKSITAVTAEYTARIIYSGRVTVAARALAEMVAPYGAVTKLSTTHARHCDLWLDPASFAPRKGDTCTCGATADFDEASAALIRT